MRKAILLFFLISTVSVVHAQVVCTNILPVVIAGNDTTIQNGQTSCTPAPVTITLNGSRSFDPDGNIISYLWIGTNGITNPNFAITTVTGLAPGDYRFVLKVTDNNGAFAYDTVHISITSARALIPVQLIPIGTLSTPRPWGIALAAAGTKIVFAGGASPAPLGCGMATVDIYDTATGTWSRTQLSEARLNAGVAVLGNRIFFGGGIVPEPFGNGCGIWNFMFDRSSVVDIYDASSNTWSTAQLSRARCATGATANNQVFFAGGEATFPVFNNHAFDTYNNGNNSWSDTLLGGTGPLRAPVTAGNKIYYAGGVNDAVIGNFPLDVWGSKRIDIYDAVSGIWSVDSLASERAEVGAIYANNKIYWAGGFEWDRAVNGYSASKVVEIRDLPTNTTSFDCLSQPRADITILRKDNKLFFFNGDYYIWGLNYFDIYDLDSTSWSIGVLPQNMIGRVISHGNNIYLTDGNQVWKLAFASCTNSSSTITTSSCDAYALNGKTYRASGIYTQKLINAANCDSIITLNLTISYSTTCTFSVTACNSYTWRGQTYTTSGFYSDTLVSFTGCDSILNLSLTINRPYNSTTSVTACSSYVWQGQTYTTSGSYSDTLVSSNGCDSIRTLNLTVTGTLFSNVTATICEGQNNSGYYTNGSFIDTLVSSNGCDSIRTLNLTVKPKSFFTTNVAVCEGDNYAGYTSGGAYTDILVASNGCDSIRTINLTVKPKSNSVISQTICEGQGYSGHTSSGIYVDTLIAVNGCDSMRTIHLTVLPVKQPYLGADTILCAGDSLKLYPGAFNSYNWQNGSTQNALIVKHGGLYSVTVTDNCHTANDEILVTDHSCDIYFPSAFTPNNDGKNDRFKVLGGYNLQGYHLAVYNRWGEKVFETSDYSKGWDGNINGRWQPSSTFVWFCEFRKPGYPGTIRMKGTVTLVR